MKTFFVSGHPDLTAEEFERHYVPMLERAYSAGSAFVVGDGPGTEAFARTWLDERNATLTLFHSAPGPTRDAAMTEASDADLTWVRPGSGDTALAENLARRTGPRFVEVERVGGADWTRYRSLRLTSLAETPDAFASTFEDEAAQPDAFWIQRVENPDVDTLIATLSGRDVGLAVVADAWDAPDCGGLYGVWVAPDARGHGVGDALVSRAVDCARRRDHRRLLLDVGDRNTAALRLYVRQGFLPTGRTGALPSPRQHITERELERLL